MIFRSGSRSRRATTTTTWTLTVKQGVGDTPRDVFYVYLDSDLHRVHAALFSVTDRNPEVTRPITGEVYEKWGTGDRLTVPRTASMTRCYRKSSGAWNTRT